MKRSLHPDEAEDFRQGDDDDAEMDVDDEEKADRDDDDNDDDEGGEQVSVVADQTNPFLDSFYGISSANAADRAKAAHVLLNYCLLGPDANPKDASYALRRLMNGLCSGRATARQGNASTLASFLKIAFAVKKIGEIRSECGKEEESDFSDLAFVRHRLLAATEPAEGRRKGSEERDYQFGRLFGINGIVRSGILLPTEESADFDDIVQVTSSLLTDLSELYAYKKWIREPAAHAVCTLLNTLYATCPSNADAQKVLAHVVENVVVPKILMNGDVDDEETTSLFASYSAEQVGIALHIQSRDHLHSNGLPSPLDKPVLTKETVELVAAALSETSVVTQPRTHLVWDALWSFLTEASESTSTASCRVDSRKVRKVCPLSGESGDDLIAGILHDVVMVRLLGINSKDDEGKTSGKTTHERRALALCLVRNLAGVEFISSISGRTRLVLDPDMFERVFNPVLVRRLFIDIICAGTARPSKQSAHILKPLALQILDQSVQALSFTNVAESLDQTMSKRLSIARALLSCEPRFDARTKTSTVEILLGFNTDVIGKEILESLWEPYMAFLENCIITAESKSQDSASAASYGVHGYIDLLFHLGKRLIKSVSDDENGSLKLKETITKHLLGFLVTVAFFDCSDLRDPEMFSPSKKKKKDKNRHSVLKRSPVVDTAFLVKQARAGAASVVSYDIRTVASARFFSLVADCVTTTAHSSSADKESRILDFLYGLHEMQNQLIAFGAKQVTTFSNPEEMDTEHESPESIVLQLRNDAHECRGTNKDKSVRAQKRWADGCAMLASTLYLHLLGCGQPDFGQEVGDPDMDDDEDREEITSFLSDLHHVSSLYSKNSNADDKPLPALAELCASILSSPLVAGNQSRGASPTLLREVVKFAWAGGLSLSAAQSEESALNGHVVNILLNAIGAIDDSELDGDDADVHSGNDEESSTGESEAEVFTSATGASEVRDEEMNEGFEEANFLLENVDEKELEIDPLRLQSMLEEGSDADIDEGELEHHEGADAALAKLIQMKQDVRKAGQLARERTEIARQIRCILLLEVLVVGKTETWGPLLRMDLVLQIVVSVLQYRRELVKALSKATEKGATTGTGEKRALLDRLTALLKTKIFKAKVPNMRWTESVIVADLSKDFACILLRQAKEADKEHQSLCNSGMALIIRSIPTNEAKLGVAELYVNAVSEWATKRTTRLDSTLFEELIHQQPVIAQACLGPALASAASTGRSTFLKSESFRLISQLYNTKLNPNVSDLDKMALDRITEAAGTVLASVCTSLRDEEMKKTKRVREVLRTAEKVIAFLTSSTRIPFQSTDRLTEIKELLVNLKKDSESQGIVNTVDLLLGAIDDLLSSMLSPLVEEHPASDESDDPDSGVSTKLKKAETATKKKQKAKKKKRR